MHRIIEYLDRERQASDMSVRDFSKSAGAHEGNWHNHLNYLHHSQLSQVDKYAAVFGLKLGLIDMTDEEIYGPEIVRIEQ